MNSLARRTVHLTDSKPGEHVETKTVRGIRIEKGIPIPPTHQVGKLKAIMLAMEVGESFFSVKRSKLDGKAKIPGREYVSRRVPGGYRIWRTK